MKGVFNLFNFPLNVRQLCHSVVECRPLSRKYLQIIIIIIMITSRLLRTLEIHSVYIQWHLNSEVPFEGGGMADCTNAMTEGGKCLTLRRHDRSQGRARHCSPLQNSVCAVMLRFRTHLYRIYLTISHLKGVNVHWCADRHFNTELQSTNCCVIPDSTIHGIE